MPVRGELSNKRRVLILRMRSNLGSLSGCYLHAFVASMLENLLMGEPSEVGEIAKEANTGAKKHGVRAARLRKIAVIQEQRQGWSYEAFHTSAGKKEYMVRKTQSERDGVQGPTGSSDEEERCGVQRPHAVPLKWHIHWRSHEDANPPGLRGIEKPGLIRIKDEEQESRAGDDRPRAATCGSCAERKLAGASAVASSAPDLTQGATEPNVGS